MHAHTRDERRTRTTDKHNRIHADNTHIAWKIVLKSLVVHATLSAFFFVWLAIDSDCIDDAYLGAALILAGLMTTLHPDANVPLLLCTVVSASIVVAASLQVLSNADSCTYNALYTSGKMSLCIGAMLGIFMQVNAIRGEKFLSK